MRKKLALFAVILATLACQIVPTPPPLTPAARSSPTPLAAFPPLSLTSAPLKRATDAVAVASAVATRPPGSLPSFPYRSGQPFAAVRAPQFQPQPLAAAAEIPLPAADLPANPQVIGGLTLRQQEHLLRTGFVVVRSREPSFDAVHRRVSLCYGQPYYLTTDAAVHALDAALDALLPVLEREELHRRMIAVLQATLDEIGAYLPLLQDAALQAEARLAAAYLAVGLQLLDPQSPPAAQFDPLLAQAVEMQVDQILAARGAEDSTLIPGYHDDFRRYQPTGHYAGDPALQDYYRGMAWLNYALLPLEDAEVRRAALIITLALRRARIDPQHLPAAATEPQPAADEWARLRETVSFLYGYGPDYGPAEYAALMDMVYPPGVTVLGLSDERLWEQFRLYARELPAEQLGIAPGRTFTGDEPARGWRWMAHGFRLDTAVLRRLESAGGADQPLGPLDLLAAFGSSAAADALSGKRSGSLNAYLQEIEGLREPIARYSSGGVSASLGDIRLLALRSQTIDRGAAFSTVQRAPAWRYKDLTAALGGWVHLRSEPAASAPSLLPAARSTPTPAAQPVSAAAPAYVEPDPESFFSLGLAASMLAEGLAQRGMTGVYSAADGPSRLQPLIADVLNLGERLLRIGEIAAAELEGVSPQASDWALIAALTPQAVEARSSCVFAAQDLAQTAELVELQSAGGDIRVAATGAVDRIFVLAPLDGHLMIAQGGVFSYYEFPEAMFGPLTTDEWRRLPVKDLPEAPGWSGALVTPGEGAPVDVLGFHIGSVFRVTSAGGRLNLRLLPQRSAAALRQLTTGMMFTLIDGPVQADGFTWWKVSAAVGDGEQVEGWLVENQAWYMRIW